VFQWLLRRRKPKSDEPLRLKSGHFYVDKEGHTWCCYQVDLHEAQHAQASCVRLKGDRTEYFFIDGRYDIHGEREHTLVRELDFAEAWEDETYHVRQRFLR
jgi:hypothetical protein